MTLLGSVNDGVWWVMGAVMWMVIGGVVQDVWRSWQRRRWRTHHQAALDESGAVVLTHVTLSDATDTVMLRSELSAIRVLEPGDELHITWIVKNDGGELRGFHP